MKLLVSCNAANVTYQQHSSKFYTTWMATTQKESFEHFCILYVD